jgi:hypothetical protein
MTKRLLLHLKLMHMTKRRHLLRLNLGHMTKRHLLHLKLMP